MIVSKRKCPYCGASPVETLIVIGTQTHHECFECCRTWVSKHEPMETIYKDEVTHFANTGEII